MSDGELIPMLPRMATGARTTSTSLHLPDELSEADWRAAGLALAHTEQSIMWWIGDWWAFGEKRYGARKAVVEAPEWEGPAYQTARNAAWVCATFEPSRRRDNLTFKHHAEVASLPADEADTLLDWAQERGDKPRATRELRAEVHRRKTALGAQPSSETCTVADLHALVATGARFGCIYADPPWQYDNQSTRAATGNHYLGMTVDELCALPVRDLAAPDAHLHLWTTNAFLFECPRIFEAWGFEFRSSLVWVKPQMGIGNYWRNSHEFLLTAIRGAHSAKPEQVRAMVERASVGPFLELFGRLPAQNWTVWGNQIERNLFMPREAA